MKRKIKVMTIAVIIGVMCVSCSNNNGVTPTAQPSGDISSNKETSKPEKSQNPVATPDIQKSYVMYNDGEEVATSEMHYGTKLRNYAPSFGYSSAGGNFKYLLTSGQRLLLVAPEVVKKEWKVDTIDQAYDVMINQGAISELAGNELKLGGVAFGTWDKINLTTEIVNMNGIESMKFEGTIGATSTRAGKTSTYERYVAGYIFICSFEKGNYPACVIGTVFNKGTDKPEDIKDSLKEELRHNTEVMMESMQIMEGGSVNVY